MKEDNNILNAVLVLIVIVGLFSCLVFSNIYIAGESPFYAICGVLITLVVGGLWQLFSDNKKDGSV